VDLPGPGGRGEDRFGFGACFDDLALSEILLGVFNGFLEHALDSESLMP